MLKALLIKQMREMLAFLTRNGKGGKRGGGGIFLYALLFVYVFGVLGMMFMGISYVLCEPLAQMGMSWLYFAILGLMALVFGVFGSIFSTKAQLYEARDNELLLAMPIPMSAILFSRMLWLYLQTFVFELLALLPCAAVYWMKVDASLSTVLCFVPMFFLMPLLALALSCVLGWLVALLSARMRHKSLMTVLLSLIFLTAYYWVYSKANVYLQYLATNGTAVAGKMQAYFYPLYLLGRAGTGDAGALAFFALLVLALFAVVYWLLSRSFWSIAARRRGAKKALYRERTLKTASQDAALLRRELGRFWSSSTYMLNCGLGAVILLVGAVLALVKAPWLRSMLGGVPQLAEFTPLLACGMVCMVAGINLFTAPSVSLEGRTLWQIQSLPVTAWQALRAKLWLHLLISGVPALLCTAAAAFALRLDAALAALNMAFTAVFILFNAASGLAVNLKYPNLHWTNETVPVKQGASVIVAMLLNWGLMLTLAGVYLLAGRNLGAALFLLLAVLVTGGLSLLFWFYLKGKGAAKFAFLS